MADQPATIRRVPMCDRTRPWTPGHPKRHCNGCDAALGDATETEIKAEALSRRQADVRNECPFCQRSKTP